MNKTLQWKVVSLLGYVALVTATIVMCGDGQLPMLVRLAAPL